MQLLNSPSDRLVTLRERADTRLALGLPAQAARASPTRALAVLHGLASSPDTAADAMALLHELQVHQVELELQQEELLIAKAEIEAALARQIVLYDRAPVAYLTLDSGGIVRELNLAAARLLGEPRDALVGLGLRQHLSPQDADRLLIAIERFRSGEASPPCELTLLSATGTPRRVLACASADSQPGQCLVVLMAIDPA